MMHDPEDILEHRKHLDSLAQSLALDPVEQDELVWETLGEGALSPPQHEGIRAWLSDVLRNRAANRRRAQNRRRFHEAVAAREEAQTPTSDLAARLELFRHLAEHVEALPEIYRDALLLRYFEDLAPREIAVRTGEKLTTIKSRLQRALQMLRQRLDVDYQSRQKWISICLPLTFRHMVGAGATASTATLLGIMSLKHILVIGAALVAILILATLDYVLSDPDLQDGFESPPAARHEPADQASRTTAKLSSDELPSRRKPPLEIDAEESLLTGHVQDAFGRPIPGARILIRKASQGYLDRGDSHVVKRGTSRSDGSFEIRGQFRGSLSVSARAKGHVTAGDKIYISAERPQLHGIRLRLQESNTLEGDVVDSSGKSIPGASITVGWKTRKLWQIGSWAETRSDQKGKFCVEDVPYGKILVLAWRKGHGLARLTSKDWTTRGLRVRLPPVQAYSIDVTLRGPSKSQAEAPKDAHFEISAYDSPASTPLPSEIRSYSFADRNKVRIPNLAPGGYRIVPHSDEAIFSSLSRYVRLTSDETMVALKVYWVRETSVNGHLTWVDGSPAAGIALSLSQADRSGFSRASDEDGNFRFPGSWILNRQAFFNTQDPLILFDRKGEKPRPSYSIIPNGKPLELRLIRAPGISGWVFDQKGRPVPNTIVFLWDSVSGRTMSSSRTRGDGSYGIAIPQQNSERLVRIEASGVGGAFGRTEDRPLHDLMTNERLCTIRVKSGIMVSGIVVNEDGHGIQGARIIARNAAYLGKRSESANRIYASRRISRAESNRSGQFHLLGFTPGRWEIGAVHPSYAKQHSGTALVLRADMHQKNVRLVLTKGLSIEGRLISSMGRPLAGVNIVCWESSRDKGNWSPDGSSKTDEQGAFVFDRLRNRRYTVLPYLPPALMDKLSNLQRDGLAHPDMRGRQAKGKEVMAGARNFVYRYEAPRYGRIHANLTHEGPLLREISVTLHGREPNKGKWKFMAPLESGLLRIEAVIAGRYDLELSSDRFLPYKSTIEVPADALLDLGDLRLEAASTLPVKLIDEEGSPLDGVWVSLNSRIRGLWRRYLPDTKAQPFASLLFATSDASGIVRLPKKPDLLVYAFKPGYSPVALPYMENSQSNASIVLHRSSELHVQTPRYMASKKRETPLKEWYIGLRVLSEGQQDMQGLYGIKPRLSVLPGETCRFIGLRAGHYQIFAVNMNRARNFRKRNLSGVYYFNSCGIPPQQTKLVVIPRK